MQRIAGPHSDEEVSALLRECSMDPDAAGQGLLHRGTFQERKSDKKKESRKEYANPHWRSRMQAGDVKVVSKKGWKPESSSNPISADNDTCEAVPTMVEIVPQSIPLSIGKKDVSPEVVIRLSDPDVIFPPHLMVPELAYGLRFGSFGSFGLIFGLTVPKGSECENSSKPLESTSEELYKVVGELSLSGQGASSSYVEADQDAAEMICSPQRADNSSGTPQIAGSDLAKDSSAASYIPQNSVPQNTLQMHAFQNKELETSELKVAAYGLFVCNLPPNTLASQLARVFKRDGNIKYNCIKVKSKQNQCFGYLEFEDACALQQAVEDSPVDFSGHACPVEAATYHYWENYNEEDETIESTIILGKKNHKKMKKKENKKKNRMRRINEEG